MSTPGPPGKPQWGQPPPGQPPPGQPQWGHAPPGQPQWGQPPPGQPPPGQPPPGQPPPGQPQWGGPQPNEPAQGPLPLRPMTLADLLDGAFRLFRVSWRTILLVTGVFLVPLQIFSAFVQRDVWGGMGFLDLMGGIDDPEVAQTFLDPGVTGGQFAGLVASLVMALIVPLVAGAVSKVAAASYLGGSVTTTEALGAVLRRSWALIASWVLVHLLQVLVTVVGLLVVVAGALAGSIPAVVVGALIAVAGLLVSVAIMALFVPTAPAVVVENLGPIQAMRRAVRLTRPRFWPVLGIALLSGLIASLVNWAIATVPTIAAFIIGLERGWILLAAGSIISGLVTIPFIAIVATLVYFDCRIRTEAFDLHLIAGGLARDAPTD